MKISDLHMRVVDKGLFLPLALRLAREVKQVSYWSPCERAFPTVRDDVGDGFDDVDRVSDCLDGYEEVDCWVFPDVGFSLMQRDLEKRGIPFWGSLGGCELELDRGLFLKTLAELDLAVPVYEKIKGITNLKLYLEDKEDKWIKISGYRGDWETFHWRSWKEDGNELDVKSAHLGPFRELLTFYVLDPIDADVEDGCDTYCVGGQFPDLVIHGMEAKDKAYVGTFQKYADLPEEMREINEAFGPVLGEYGYRNFFSTEVRITKDGTNYFIDPTCRAGSPPSQVQCEMIDNLAEIIWAGAHGEIIDPYPAAKFGVQAIVSISGNRNQWRYCKVDDELSRWLKCGNCMQSEDLMCFPPDSESNDRDVGWLVGIGDTFEEAITHLKHNIELLPCGACCDSTQLCGLLKEVEEAEKQGMEFSDEPIPKPEKAL